MNRHRGLLAVTADATRSGATLLLGSLLRELGRDGAIDPDRTRVLAGSGGGRDPRLLQAGTVRVAVPAAEIAGEAAARVHPRARPTGEKVGLAWGLLRDLRRDPGPPDVVWAHGETALHLVDALPRPARRAPLVAHVQSEGVGLRRALGDRDVARALAPAAVVVASSERVRRHLVHDLGLEPARVTVHLPWVPDLGPEGPPPVTSRRPDGAPADALVVAACGTLGWRRGADLFLELAGRLPREVAGRPVHLVWVGGAEDGSAAERFAADVRARDLTGRLDVVGEVDDPAPWLAGCDLLVGVGRTEALPTATLEAAARGRPTVGWPASGMGEVLPEDGRQECLVPDLDGRALAARVVAVLAEPGLRRALGTSAHAHVLTHHQARPAVRALWSDVAAHLARRL
ncbi:glycosyltransferase family 4 protein [Iamia majanohamensis]|uniref:Glycosyltransferase family 4 protein n=1 Tax=Iamia majanohamensis TaxID=467976 RepID=A0AAF0BT16_9ACTN|nr:glycosyltransferase family 4 protein [Iamia majanohamensis]WCO66172.1 glycosyltransferase family 4 protein [Iamia majanohamensis]